MYCFKIGVARMIIILPIHFILLHCIALQHCIVLCLNTCNVNKHLCLGLKCQVSSTVPEPEHNACLSIPQRTNV